MASSERGLNSIKRPLLTEHCSARACMILGCSTAPDYLNMAKEAVRVAELALSRCDSPGEFENQLVADCRTVCREAQAAFDAARGSATSASVKNGEQNGNGEREGESK